MVVSADRNGDKKAAKKALQHLHTQSIRPLKNPLHRAPMGNTNGRGLYALCWPEVLHQSEAGLLKKSIACTIKGVVKTGISK